MHISFAFDSANFLLCSRHFMVVSASTLLLIKTKHDFRFLGFIYSQVIRRIEYTPKLLNTFSLYLEHAE